MMSPQVFLIEVSYGQMKNNNYLIVDESTSQALLIDPAWEKSKIDAALLQSGSQLAGILLTHAHFDHIDLARPISEFYNCPIWMSEDEINHSGFNAPRLIAIGDNPWNVGAMTIEPIHTPGHTPGCICYKIGNNLFTGDVLFAEGCGICTDINSAREMYFSLDRLKNIIPSKTHIFPGHTYYLQPGQTFEKVMKSNMYLQFTDAESFVSYRLRKTQNLNKILNFKQ